MLSKETQIKAGELTADVVEFFAHQYLHHTEFHMKHHQIANRNGMIDGDYFKPWWMSAPGRKEKLGLKFLTSLFYPLKPLFPHFYETVKGRADKYYEEHAKGHRDPYYIWENLPNHALHHVFQSGYWGVTNSTIDDLFRTAPEVDQERLERVKMIYIERGERKLPTIKAQAKKEREEFEKKCMAVFNKAMDGLDYVAEKRWKLERMVRDISYKMPNLGKSS